MTLSEGVRVCEANTLFNTFEAVRLSCAGGGNFLQSAASKSYALATLPTHFVVCSESEARFWGLLNSIDKVESLNPKLSVPWSPKPEDAKQVQELKTLPVLLGCLSSSKPRSEF